MNKNTDPLPLTGITILDLTTFLSGPFATQILSDLGARIIKVEPPIGDSSRSIPPHFVEEDSAYFLANNRNKESLVLDLKTLKGQEIVRKLVTQSDIVVENYRPGVATKLGLDAEELRLKQPSLIWASISGFGQDGPWKDRAAYDMIVQALSGVMSLTGEPGQEPVRLGIPAGDLVAGLFAVIGITSALFHRQKSGEGQTIDVSMLDGQLSMLSYQAIYAMFSGTIPQPQGSAHDSIPTYRSFVAGDGRMFVVTANTQRMWQELCEVIGDPGLSQHPMFDNASNRLQNKEALWELLETAFSSRNAQHWVSELTARSVPAALIKTVPEALTDAKESGRGMIVNLQAKDGRQIDTLATPIRFEGRKTTKHTYPPRLGEHSKAILEEIGVDDAAFKQLVEEGVLNTPPTSGM